MSRTKQESNMYLASFLAGAVGLFSLLFLPFAGFTERIRYVPSDIYRDYGMTGIGTHGFELNILEYPASLWIIQVLVLVLAVVLVVPVWRCWTWYRSPDTGAGPAVRQTARVAALAAGVFVVLVAIALLVMFPSVEEHTIWATESRGWVYDWWLEYGAVVTLAGIGGMAVLLTRLSRGLSSVVPGPVPLPGAPPPPQPPPPPGD